MTIQEMYQEIEEQSEWDCEEFDDALSRCDCRDRLYHAGVIYHSQVLFLIENSSREWSVGKVSTFLAQRLKSCIV